MGYDRASSVSFHPGLTEKWFLFNLTLIEVRNVVYHRMSIAVILNMVEAEQAVYRVVALPVRCQADNVRINSGRND